MRVTVNGEEQEIEPCTLAELLQRFGLHGRRCATMINGRIIKREAREQTSIQEGDSVDIVAMVGGG